MADDIAAAGEGHPNERAGRLPGRRIKPEQKGFVAPVSWSLAQAYVVPPEKVWPRLVYDGGQLVGFVMAAFDPDNERDLWHSFLWRLSIGADSNTN